MKVELIDSMGNDLRVANVARVSFNKWKEELDDKDVKLIHYLAKHEHTSPFRHTAISVRCEAPIFIARQLGKHQVGLAWNEVSRRYVDEQPSFFAPVDWRARAENKKQGSSEELVEVMSVTECKFKTDPHTMYEAVLKQCMFVYNEMLANGVCPEQARMVLPQSMYTSWIWTGSLQAFHHVYRLRSEEHAQKEAQEFAQMLADVIQPIFPNCWEALND